MGWDWMGQDGAGRGGIPFSLGVWIGTTADGLRGMNNDTMDGPSVPRRTGGERELEWEDS